MLAVAMVAGVFGVSGGLGWVSGVVLVWVWMDAYEEE